MDRMATTDEKPDSLRELFAALGNDPFVIANVWQGQCLADALLTWLGH